MGRWFPHPTAWRLGAALTTFAFASPADAAGDRELGAYLAGPCSGCHRTASAGAGGIPAIAGLPEDGFAAAMTAYRTRQRDNPAMQAVAARLSDADIAALAAYFAALRPTP